MRLYQCRSYMSSYRYWTHQLDCLPAYHNCLLWCYERLTPDGDLQRAMMEYNPIDYLSSGRKSVTYPTAVALFTFACKLLRRFEDLLVSKMINMMVGLRDSSVSSLLMIFLVIFAAILIFISNPSLITGSPRVPTSCAF